MTKGGSCNFSLSIAAKKNCIWFSFVPCCTFTVVPHQAFFCALISEYTCGCCSCLASYMNMRKHTHAQTHVKTHTLVQRWRGEFLRPGDPWELETNLLLFTSTYPYFHSSTKTTRCLVMHACAVYLFLSIWKVWAHFLSWSDDVTVRSFSHAVITMLHS